jgi:nitrogen fixation NifU-like protein
MNESLDQMYREVILDHYKSPRGRRPISKTDFTSEGHNPACGDDITLKIALSDGIITEVFADSRGCAISTASSSIMAELIKGKGIDEAQKLAANVKKMLKGEDANLPNDLGDIEALEGVRQFPVRIKCALLGWMTLLEGIRNYESGNKNEVAVISTETEED